jgi:hypothetical protein
MTTTHIVVPKSRTFWYAGVYLLILAAIACFAGNAVTSFFAWGIPIKLFIWIDEHLWFLLGLFIATVVAILAWPLADRRTPENTKKVYYNPYWNPEVCLTYLTGFHIGNILEKLFSSPISLIIKKWTTPKEEPLAATCTDDVLRVWGTLIVQETDSRILTLAKEPSQRLDVALEIAKSKVESLIEQFTYSKLSNQILGRGEVVTQHVMSQINTLDDIVSRGFNVSWTTANMDESLKAKEAREQLKSSELFAEAVNRLATPPEETYKESGELKPGVITREESAAIELARTNKGSFKRDVQETVIRVVGDTEVLEKLKGHGLLVGTAAAGELENQTTK